MLAESTEIALRRAYEEERASLFAIHAQGKEGGVYESPVFGSGPFHPWLMLIGEAPGAQEVLEERAFAGKAGRQLNALLAKADIHREEIYITNAVKFRPVIKSARSLRNRTPRLEEIQSALPLLQREICLLQPHCIATLGNVPLNAVLQLFGQGKRAIGEVHGSVIPLVLQGQPLLLFPLYHPASTIYNRALTLACEEDATNLGKLYALRCGCEQSVKQQKAGLPA